MKRTALYGMFSGLFFLGIAGVLIASDADEFPELAERLEKESAEQLEAAERIEQKTKEGGKREGRPSRDIEAHQLEERLKNLRAKEQEMSEGNAPEQELAEVHQQILNTELEIKKIHSHHIEPGKHHPELHEQAEKLEIATRRIQHMRVAAENLKMAELHDFAHQVMQQAEAMERDVHDARQRLAAAMHEGQERHRENGPDVVRELRGEIERLRAEVKELSQKVEKR